MSHARSRRRLLALLRYDDRIGVHGGGWRGTARARAFARYWGARPRDAMRLRIRAHHWALTSMAKRKFREMSRG